MFTVFPHRLRFLLPIVLTLGLIGVILLWCGVRPGRYDGMNLVTSFGLVEIAAEKGGMVLAGGEPGDYEWEFYPGFLHIGMYSRGGIYMREDWGVARIDRSSPYQSFDEVEKVHASFIPILTGSEDRGGLHLCSGYPQAAGWLALFTIAAWILAFRRKVSAKT